MAKLRRLTESGIAEFAKFIDARNKGEQDLAVPANLLSDEPHSEPVSDVEVVVGTFTTRIEAAQYADNLFQQAGVVGMENDRGLWAWLCLLHFHLLCPKDKKGQFKAPGATYRWIPSADYRHKHRHLLSGPYKIYRFYKDTPDRAVILLCNPVTAPGEFVEQLASRQEFLTNRGIIGSATLLYYDVKTKRAKRGTSPTEHTPGTLRRFIDVVQQLDVTYDLYSLDRDGVLKLLPAEFKAAVEAVA